MLDNIDNPFGCEDFTRFSFPGKNVVKVRVKTMKSYLGCMKIGEFRIIGFYRYHVISNRPSDSNGTSGSCAVLLNIDYDRGSSSYYD